ncbi:MAG: AraC family transcriptional regulator, partial [Myxococcota bacterium]
MLRTSQAMDLKALIDRVDRHTREKGVNNVCAPVRQVVPGLHLFRQDTPTSIDASIYNPIVCLILQGRKETTVGDRCFGVTAGECVIVSHVLPTMARITHASPTEPYLAVVFPLDLAELRSIDRE